MLDYMITLFILTYYLFSNNLIITYKKVFKYIKDTILIFLVYNSKIPFTGLY